MPDQSKLNGRRIRIGSDLMAQACDEGVEWYTPTFPRLRLHEEGGVTATTTENLAALRKSLAARNPTDASPVAVIVGPNLAMLIKFPTTAYLATGFGLGYAGTGPNGLAAFLSSCGFGLHADILKKVVITPRSFRGDLLSHFGFSLPLRGSL